MATVSVKFFGTLGQGVPGYDPEKGLDVEIGEGAKVIDLLVRLNLFEVRGGVVTAGGKVLLPEEPLKDGMSVQVLQTVDGG